MHSQSIKFSIITIKTNLNYNNPLNAPPSFIEVVATPQKGIAAALRRSSVGNYELIHVHRAIKNLVLLLSQLKIMIRIVRVQKVITFSLVEGAKLIELPALREPSQQRIRANGL